MKQKRRICWVTASYMLQVDLPLLSRLAEEYDIHWWFRGDPESSSAALARRYAERHGLRLLFHHPAYWWFSPAGIAVERRFVADLAREDYDLWYFDVSTFPFLYFAISALLPHERVVIAMHHGKIHSGMRFKTLYRPFLRMLNASDFNLQYFSQSQAEAFRGADPSREFVIPLAINDFGESSMIPPDDKVVFTVFGNIIPSKNVELLIRAADMLWERMPGQFVVRIVGHCRDWQSRYAPLIGHPEAFATDIRRIDETEIPDLFAATHWLVLPYRSVTQSGPLRIAYGYDTPVIASDLEGFRESVVEDVTGLLFRSGSAEALADRMAYVVARHPEVYTRMRSSLKDYVARNLSTDSVCRRYTDMFNSIINSAR